jgi:hypothetical protein
MIAGQTADGLTRGWLRRGEEEEEGEAAVLVRVTC